MPEIKKYNPAGVEALDSREVAELVKKRHDHLLRDINGYISEMEKTTAPKVGVSETELKIEPSGFFNGPQVGRSVLG